MAITIPLRGVLLDNDSADIYRWWGWRDITCPSDIADALAAAPEGEEVTVLINSPGGDMTVGGEIYSLLRLRRNCRALVQGYCASAATMAMMGCAVRESEPGALLCYHNPSCTAEGDWRALLHASDGAKNAKDAILDLYMARGATDREAVSALMDEDIWITPARALELGLLDKVSDFEGEETPVVGIAASAGALPILTGKMRSDYADHIRAMHEAEEAAQALAKDTLATALELLAL